ncbi:hypothetical protein CBR_g12963 [Chara braunii]|uniref:Reverse transcriptase domain-containing protein n=1 Tax=Chara braunii TaxID=69332 RepID=A0A388KT54_CHABU|nr:hypothetical protein CBR_g12963 [Chara braunii]|eukprot:GBG73245.1 hypothetical protein CBR_g12963 [Chara braunii]
MRRSQRLAERESKSAKPQQGSKAPQLPHKRRTAMAAAAGHADSNMSGSPKRPVPPPVPVQRADEDALAFLERLQHYTETNATELRTWEKENAARREAIQLQQEAEQAAHQQAGADSAAAARQQQQQLEASQTQARFQAAMNLLNEEAAYGRVLRQQHFRATEEQDEPTEDERNRETTAVLIENLLYTCNWQQRELLAMRQVLIRHEGNFKAMDQHITALQADTGMLQAADSQQQAINDRLQDSLDERINHIVTSLGDISKFAGASTVSNQLQTLSDRVDQRPTAAAKEWKMSNFKIEKFDDYHKTDPLQWWMAFNTEADVHHTPPLRRMDTLYLQLIGGAQQFMTHMAVTLECTIATLHTKIMWEEFEKKWKTRFMVNNDKRRLEQDLPHLPRPTTFAGMADGVAKTRRHPGVEPAVRLNPSIRQSIQRNDIEEMGICFLHALPPGDQLKTDTSDPHIIELLDNYEDVFQAPAGVIPDRPICHGITLEDGAVPPRGCIYRMSEEELQVLRAQLDDLLAKGWIRPSCLPYGALVLFVRKKNKDLRLCIDYRKLNAQTIKNADPLPRIDDLLERLVGAKYFSKLGLKSGYHQIEIQPRDRYKTAFKTRYGHFEWIVMPFGLTNAPATFQAAMTTEFLDVLDRPVLIYLDDILVYSRSLDEHLEHLRAILERLHIAKYKANRDKCEFAQQELEYLGHYVTPQGIRPLADKVQAIQDWPDLKCTTDVRSFLGLASHYMRFVKGFQRIAAPLSRLQSPLVRFEFSDEARHAFHTLKTALLQAPVLSIYNPTLPTKVTTDAFGYGIGAVWNSMTAQTGIRLSTSAKRCTFLLSLHGQRGATSSTMPWLHFCRVFDQFGLGYYP